MESEDIKKCLLELFPKLDENRAKFLATTGDDINVLITRVLDNNIDPPTVEIKDFCRVDSHIEDNKSLYHAKPHYNNKHNACYLSAQQSIQTTASNISLYDNYNYPEVFEKTCSIDMHVDVEHLRKKAADLNKQASRLYAESAVHQFKQARCYFGMQADEKGERAKELNRKAAMVLMRRIVEGSGAVDLHGFTVEEASKFMDDLYKFRRFKKIKVITGQVHNSARVRPAMKRWFERNSFRCYDDGPCIVAVKPPEY
ncbi:uncharacterized protein VICG_01781 [Vittaforma corneae ATCC 50505]|uniref:Smr domain-containing protein n=1 Tax=Vittaforma corneae (strain ATCC 50505) TaxID=993615 RepID=L2GLM9_VITCO|nr:uncharacterized protein VICG_01781 [Vittaforma corneae ATCC 50505]ELA41182.1 hypothetical protein VICG_01781 [Vittaforma corneae ATCC 50505]